MNIQQLIEELQKHPPEMRVIVRGYEGGYDDVEPPELTQIRLNVHAETDWFYGRHEDADHLLGSQDGAVETALLIR